MFSVQFYGVRGSTPSCDPEIVGYGGNTSCVLVSVPGMQPIVLDLGTGLRSLGLDLMAARTLSESGRSGSPDSAAAGPSEQEMPPGSAASESSASGSKHRSATALLTHLHWDHVQGLPFFAPILQPDFQMEIFGPPQLGSGLERAVREFMKPPLFPVSIESLPGRLAFTEVTNRSFLCGAATISAFPVPHVGATNGYRIEVGDASLAYVPDHQQLSADPSQVPRDVVANCHGVDILIHDAQYDSAEFDSRSKWGHCTAEFAVSMAVASKVKRLVLFHHDPSHTDLWIEESLGRAQAIAPAGLEVVAAAEGLTMASGLPALVER